MKIALPFPPRELNPNARSHWAVVARKKAAVRGEAKLLTRSAMNSAGMASAAFEGDFPIPIQVTFYPPDKRRRDDDNMVAAFKALRDGIADALCVDDRRFRPHYFFADPEKPGRVEVCVG